MFLFLERISISYQLRSKKYFISGFYSMLFELPIQKNILIINWNEMIFICYQSYKWRFIKLNLFFFYQLCTLRSKGDIWLFLYIKLILKLSNKKKNSEQYFVLSTLNKNRYCKWKFDTLGNFQQCPIVCNMFFTKKFFSYVLIEIKETHACKTRILFITSWLF